MPELPEVETVRRGLASRLVGRVIERVEVRLPRIVRSPSVEAFCAQLQGATVQGMGRRGKHLLFDLGAYTMVSHLRMEGRYALCGPDDPIELHTHVLFTFTDHQSLRYRDVRQFGTMDLVLTRELDQFSSLASLGLEPLDAALDASYLQERCGRRKAPVKAVLLNQTIIAGLGNIYVDEILFAARIHPETAASEVDKAGWVRIAAATHDVITRAIRDGGSTVRTYVNDWGEAGSFQLSLNVYGRTGEPCRVCGEPIVKGRVAGRGTHVCVHCQRAPRQATIRLSGSKIKDTQLREG